MILSCVVLYTHTPSPTLGDVGDFHPAFTRYHRPFPPIPAVPALTHLAHNQYATLHSSNWSTLSGKFTFSYSLNGVMNSSLCRLRYFFMASKNAFMATASESFCIPLSLLVTDFVPRNLQAFRTGQLPQGVQLLVVHHLFHPGNEPHTLPLLHYQPLMLEIVVILNPFQCRCA